MFVKKNILLLALVGTARAWPKFGGKPEQNPMYPSNEIETGEDWLMPDTSQFNSPDFSDIGDFLSENGRSIAGLSGNDEKFKKQFLDYAHQSIADEAEKFEEALLAIMTGRVNDYLYVKTKWDGTDSKAKQILNLKEFREILDSNLIEFKEFYTEKIAKIAPAFAKKETQDYAERAFKNSAVSAIKTKLKSLQEESWEAVDRLNQKIFDDSMSHIKQMMTIAVMET